jgi:hypothetical protein
MTKKLLGCPALLIVIFALPARGQTVTASSCSSSAITSAWARVTSSTTLFVIPACSVSSGTGAWTLQVSLTVPSGSTNLTIQGAGSQTTLGGGDATVIIDNFVSASPLLTIVTAGPSSFFRITGITFQGGNDGGNQKGDGFIAVSGATQNFRLDHSHFNISTYNPGAQSNAIKFYTQIYGVVDHCLFDSPPASQGNQVDYYPDGWSGGSFGDGSWADATTFGSNRFIFLEDNIDNNSFINNAQSAGRMVIRHNTLNGNGTVQTHALGQGEQRGRAGRAMEIYQNVFNGIGSNPFYYAMWVASGTWMIWGNTVTNYQHMIDFVTTRYDSNHTQVAPPNGWGYCGVHQTGSPSAWDQNADSTGDACMDQVGRGQGDLLNGLDFPNALNSATGTIAWPRQRLEPVYEWLDKFTPAPGYSGTVVQYGNQIKANRDYFLYTTTFNGSSGVGSGTTNQRPTSCKPNSVAYPAGNSPGVGYWNTDNNTLYVCTATNVWTAYYTPYTYPHPLVTGSRAGNPIISITRPSVGFGTVNVGSSSQQTATITNTGTADEILSSSYYSITGTNATDFTNVTTAAPALVQTTSVDAGTTSTATLPFNVNNLAGDWIGVIVRAGGASPTITVTDSKGNTYQKALQFTQTTDGHADAIFYAENIAAGANSVVVTLNASNTLRFSIVEFSGIKTSRSLDVTGFAQGSSMSPSSGNVTTTQNWDLVLGGISTGNTQGFTVPGNNFQILNTPGNKLLAEYQYLPTAGPIAATTFSTSDNWAAGVATFKAANTAGGNGCVSGGTISANGGTCTVTMLFTPAANGTRTATLNIAGTVNASVNLTGVGQTTASIPSNRSPLY